MTRPRSTSPLAGRGLLPGEHYVDSGTPRHELFVSTPAGFGITLVTPMLADTSPQARAGAGYDRTAFAIDFDAQQATCPQGHASSPWTPSASSGTNTIVITCAASTCLALPGPNPVHQLGVRRRQLTVRPRDVHEAQPPPVPPRGPQAVKARIPPRAGVEGTIRQAAHVTGIRKARDLGLGKTRLEHNIAAAAINLIRLDAWWTGHPLDRTRTSHLARLELALAS